MKKSLLIVSTMLAILAVLVSCGKKEKAAAAETPGVESPADPAGLTDATDPTDPIDPTDSTLSIASSSSLNVMSMDDVEHKLPEEWRKHTIEVTGQKGKGEYEPDMKAIYDAIVEVFPLPMLVQWGLHGTDSPGVWEREAEIVCDQDNFYIGGCWKDPMGNFDDHFELKAWQVNAGTWTVGLNYQPLWDGDDGIGVYGRQLFWSYGPHGDATLYPIPADEDRPLPISEEENPVFDRYENAVNFPGAFDPAAARLYWNGWWFAPRN